jgi:hypothetical protein
MLTVMPIASAISSYDGETEFMVALWMRSATLESKNAFMTSQTWELPEVKSPVAHLIKY